MQLRGRIREQIDAYNRQPFQKREGFRPSFGAGTGNERPPTGSAGPPTSRPAVLALVHLPCAPMAGGLESPARGGAEGHTIAGSVGLGI